jgi:hypothetical protein
MNEKFGDCPTQEEIDEYTTKIVAIFMYLVDSQVDPTNYRNPIQKYIQSITAGVGSIQSFEESYVFYSPLKVRTKEKSIFGHNKDIESLFFDSNLKLSATNDEKYFKYTRFTHFIQNNVQIYERRYDDIFEALSHIGGIIQCMFNILYWINFFYNRYIIISDTNKVFFSIIEKRADSLNGDKIKQLNSSQNQNNKSNLNDSSIKELKIKPKSSTLIENLINKFSYGYNSSKESNNSFSKENEDGKSIKKYNKTNFLYINGSNKNKESKNKSNNCNNNIFITNKIKELHYHSSNKKLNKKFTRQRTISFGQEKLKADLNFDLINNNLANQTIKLSQLFANKIKLKKKYSFLKYIKSICSSKINNVHFLTKYRKGLLSEENFLKSHINNIMVEKHLYLDKY